MKLEREHQGDNIRLSWVFSYPAAYQMPVKCIPEKDRIWIIEFPQNDTWWYWPFFEPNIHEELPAFTFEDCLLKVKFQERNGVWPRAPVNTWRIRNVENDKEVMYVGLIL